MDKFADDSVVSCDGITMEVEEAFPDGLVVVSRYLMTTGVRYSRMEFPGDSHYDNSIIDHDDSLDSYINDKMKCLYGDDSPLVELIDEEYPDCGCPTCQAGFRCVYSTNPNCGCAACIELDDIYPRD